MQLSTQYTRAEHSLVEWVIGMSKQDAVRQNQKLDFSVCSKVCNQNTVYLI